jgi:hypothetical protein
MVFSLITRWTEVYVVLAVFLVMILTMLWAGAASVRQARLLHLRWVGYGQGIGWFAMSVLMFALFSITVYGLIANGLPENFQHVNLLTWAWLALNLAFALFVGITMEMSVRNLKHMAKETREQFAETKRAMQQLRHKTGDG